VVALLISPIENSQAKNLLKEYSSEPNSEDYLFTDERE